MILESVRARRKTLARIWSKAALLTCTVVALLAAAGWRLAGWDWATPILSAAATAAVAMTFVDDIFFDRTPWSLPQWLRPAWRWAWDNSMLILYPLGWVVGIIAGRRLGWEWVTALAILLGVSALSEAAVLILSRRIAGRSRRRDARAFGSAVVSTWFCLSATLMLTAALLQHPDGHGANALHWLIPMCAVAAVHDYYLVRRRARKFPR